MDEKRAPDPFRPSEVPEGKPYQGVGRPGTAVFVVGLIVLIAAALLVYAVAK